MKNKCFIGLGVMGYTMAGHISQGGYEVSVFNRSKEKSRSWNKDYGGRVSDSPIEAVKGCDMAFLCVGKDEDVEQVVLGANGILEGISPGGIVIDHTTTSSVLAKKLEKECHKKEIFFIDAPVPSNLTPVQPFVIVNPFKVAALVSLFSNVTVASLAFPSIIVDEI